MNIQAWLSLIADSSSYLKGDNPRHWFADYDWLINSENAVKVLEGRYPDKHQVSTLAADSSDSSPSYNMEEFIQLSMQAIHGDEYSGKIHLTKSA